jgi:hypothetical protein
VTKSLIRKYLSYCISKDVRYIWQHGGPEEHYLKTNAKSQEVNVFILMRYPGQYHRYKSYCISGSQRTGNGGE